MPYSGDALSRYIKDEPLIINNGELNELLSGMIWTDATVLSALGFSVLEPVTDISFFSGSTTQFEDDPFILDEPRLADLGGDSRTVLWTDAARCPRTISTLLIIGV